MPSDSRLLTPPAPGAPQFTAEAETQEPTSVRSPEVRATLDSVRGPLATRALTHSPEDWRDGWIYFAMIDRFNNPSALPRHRPFDDPFGGFQGGTIDGLRQRLDYLEALGAGAIWITPVLKNVPLIDGQPNEGTYHGYGIQNFLAVDPRFASDPKHADREFRRLVDEAHERGMYVILDIVLNHTGDVFAYAAGDASVAGHSDAPLGIRWRDEHGHARADWSTAAAIGVPSPDAAVFPDEVRRDAFFRRQGAPSSGGPETLGDFGSLKQLVTRDRELDDALIRCYQYVIARYDIDGFRVDTLKYLDRDFARVFGNAMREFALSVGKRNFFTFGEVYDDEATIARFIGRSTQDDDEVVGVDAALDFPLFFRLPGVLKGLVPPEAVARVYERRKEVERQIISSHGEATRFFVTFLDNHDQHERFRFVQLDEPDRFDDQLTLSLACLFTLPGIPCVYYGTEQGLSGRGQSDQNVREALWGMPKPFDTSSPFFVAIQKLTALRRELSALRYGRFYFRPLSGDHVHFGLSPFPGGVLAFSRILSDSEVLVVANTSVSSPFTGDVIVDASLRPEGHQLSRLYSNMPNAAGASPVRSTGAVEIHEADGRVSGGPAHVTTVTLRPMEVMIFA